MKTIFCIDASGSVIGTSPGEIAYHNVTGKILNNFYKNGDIIYLWGSSYKPQSLSEFQTWNNANGCVSGGNLSGTASELIGDIIYKERNKGIEHWVIFTDGSVNSNSVDNSDKKMKNYNILYKLYI